MTWLKSLFRRRVSAPVQQEISITFGLSEYDLDLHINLPDLDHEEVLDPLAFRPTQTGTLQATLTQNPTPGEPYLTLHLPSKP